jgi:hypothetical protein
MQRDRRTYLIREVLESYLAKNRQIGYRVKKTEALRVWAKICGDWVASHSEAFQVKDGILLIKTDSPILANELSLKERELVEAMNRELAYPLLKRIVFKSGFVEKHNSKDKAAPSEVKKKLTMETVKRVDRLVETVKEEELRDLLRKLFISSAKSKKRK